MQRFASLFWFFLLPFLLLPPFGTSASAATLFGEQQFKLPNGLQVIVIPNHRAPTVTQWLWYKVGAADEQRGRSGAAHFLEHLMFRGTKTVKPKEFSVLIGRVGGNENAMTSWDYTAYHQTIAANQLDLIMRLEADRMQNLVITEDQLGPERNVVLEEWRMRTGNEPSAELENQAQAALYLNHPYRIPVLGWLNEIEQLDVATERQFYNTWYAPNNAVLVIAGDVTLEQVKTLAEKYYGPIPAKPVPARFRVEEPDRSADTIVTLKDPRVRQAEWQRLYLAPSYRTALDDQRPYALVVLAEALGGGPSSRLYRALVLDQSLAVASNAWYDGSRYDLGQFAIASNPRPGVTLDRIGAATEKIVSALLAQGLSVDEVESAKKRLITSELYAQDSLTQPPNIIGRALTTGRTLEQLDKWPQRIASVTAAEVNAAAHQLLAGKPSVTSLLLPVEGTRTVAQPVVKPPEGEIR